MKTKIVVDSSSNLYTLSGVDFACVPLKIVTDDGEYLDTAELDAVGMAQTLRSYKGKTGTSCPNVADWLAAYEGAEEVFVVTITGTLSGSYNAAQLAAEGTNALLQALHADPASTLYVGDSNVDVETAHNANLPCCGAVWGFRTREELNAAGAEYLAENSDELYDVIMK